MTLTKEIVQETLWGDFVLPHSHQEMDAPHTTSIPNGGEIEASAKEAIRSPSPHSEQTKIASFIQLKEEGQLGERQKEVFKQISLHPRCSDKELSHYCNLPINCITARRNELVKLQMIKQDGAKLDQETKRMVAVWVVL